MKVNERLQGLVDDGIVQEVVRPLMSGKEAALYIVIVDGYACAAKVYKDAENRSFKHRAGYTEGRRVRNSRQRRAMEKSTRFGKEMMEGAWQNAEVDALYRMAAAGLRVPRPHLFSEGVLLMDLIIDPEGQPAPRFWDFPFDAAEARKAHEFLIRQIVMMLCAGMVHGDLSEYNVLMAWDGPVIIDFPQATEAANNANAKTLFLRDVQNITNFLATFAPELAESRFGEEIWGLYERAQLFVDTPLTGRWRGSERKADTRAVLGEIETAARDARRKREIEGIREKPAKPQQRPEPQRPAQQRPAPQRPAPQRPAPQARPPAPARKAAPEAREEDPFDDLDALLRTD